MSAPIRPLPIEAASQRTETDAKTTSTDSACAFGKVLDLHLDERAEKADEEELEEPKKNTPPTGPEPWTLLGASALFIPIVPPGPVLTEPPPPPPNGGIKAVEKGGAEDAQPLTDRGASDSQAPVQIPAELLERFRLSQEQHNLPVTQTPAASVAEQIAAKPEENGIKGGGIADAQQRPMLLQTHDEERSAESSVSLGQEQIEPAGHHEVVIHRVLMVEEKTSHESAPEAIAFRVEGPAHSATPMEGPLPETRLEETKSVNTAATVQAIHGHVQLLRASNQNEL